MIWFSISCLFFRAVVVDMYPTQTVSGTKDIKFIKKTKEGFCPKKGRFTC
jgi:hypothetical protein